MFFLKKNNPQIKYWFTGHSLGAAVASIAAASFKHFHALYTFGSPKVGNLAFSKGLEKKTFRIVNYNDPITFLPPSFNKKENKYVHHGKVKFINKDLTIHNKILSNDNHLTRSISLLSKNIDNVFDKNNDIFFEILNLQNMKSKKETGSSPVTPLSQLLIKIKNIILKHKELNITDHAPIYYALNLWNIYRKS